MLNFMVGDRSAPSVHDSIGLRWCSWDIGITSYVNDSGVKGYDELVAPSIRTIGVKVEG